MVTFLRRRGFQFDCHCIYCNKETTFRSTSDRPYLRGEDEDWAFGVTEFEVTFSCQRISSHKYTYYFHRTNSTVVKVGQYPSLEDISSADILRFKSLLGQANYSELHRAGGLAAHGVGIGSFVYLRRIFERLIVQHHSALPQPIDGFERMRMDEKIKALEPILPPALVKNRAVYGILSVGLHELTEDACRKHFPVVRAAIIQILEQDLQAQQREQAAKDLEKAIQDAALDLRSAPPGRG